MKASDKSDGVGRAGIVRRRTSDDLTHYEPEGGLKRLVVAEAMEKHYRRAKDATGLCDAVELKLSEQRKFVLWWDQQEKHPGNQGAGRGQVRPSQTGDGLKLQALGLDSSTVHRWRVRLADPRKYAIALEMAQALCVKVCEASRGVATDQRGASGTGEEEWYTPPEYVEAARDVLGTIDLDPASSAHAQKWIKATRYLDKAADGLAHEWPGRVWLNPPYMQPDIAHFVEKLCAEVEAGRTTAAIMLTHNYTDTAWFHRAAGTCAAICFTRGRVAFLNPAGEPAAPTQGQAFFYFGSAVAAFDHRFTAEGFVVVPR
jgi:ParB family chromosome partitioning protein